MRPRVFIIDDEPVDQALVRSAFQRVGSDALVDVIPDIAVAIGFLEEQAAPALLIVDLRLGVESGLELVEWVRGNQALRALPMIVISGSDDPKDIAAAYRAGANAYVVKPPDLESTDRLIRAIDQFWLQAAALPEVGERNEA